MESYIKYTKFKNTRSNFFFFYISELQYLYVKKLHVEILNDDVKAADLFLS